MSYKLFILHGLRVRRNCQTEVRSSLHIIYNVKIFGNVNVYDPIPFESLLLDNMFTFQQ